MPSYSPYDWNESIQQRNEYIEDRLRDGSPVVALTYENGLLLFSMRQTQRKVFEIYDRIMMSAIGNQSDVESIRSAAIDVAHSEGFSRSAEDVSIQRMISFRISPAIKKIYSDPFAQPTVYKGLFAELGKTPERDRIMSLSYDGEYSTIPDFAVIAGTAYAEDRMREHLKREPGVAAPSLADALARSIEAWGVGMKRLEADDRADADYSSSNEDAADVAPFVREHLEKGWIMDAGLLERNSHRESRFRSVSEDELNQAAAKYR